MNNIEKTQLTIPRVIGSVFKGDCDKNIYWYDGVYRE